MDYSLETLKIVAPSGSGFTIINKSDYDPNQHVLFEAKSKAKKSAVTEESKGDESKGDAA